jgi:integrase/recombinase XerD
LPLSSDAKAGQGCRKRRNQVPDWSEIGCRFPPKSPAAFNRNPVPVCPDFCSLLIRETKFRKTRLVPLHDTAVAGLQRYLDRRGPGSDDDPVFIDKRGRPLRYIAVKETFDRLVDQAGIKSRSGRRPRLHDLRHTFAVRALQGSPAGRGRCGAHMVALATYMGHVNIYATYWYLEATADLLRDVATAGEAFMSEGRSA